jgi:hypothetical protein
MGKKFRSQDRDRKSYDFDDYFTEDLDDEADRLIGIVHGKPKTGKTRFALTAPGPVAYLTNDRSYLSTVKYAKECGKEIHVSKFFFEPPDRTRAKDKNYVNRVKSEAEPLYQRFKEAFFSAHYSKKIRSIIIDNGTTTNHLCMSALYGKTSKIMPRDRGSYNDEMRKLYQFSHDFDKNVIWIHRPKEEWKDDKPTGVMLPEGWKDAPFEVQVVVETLRKYKTQRFKAVITDCSHDAGLIGEVLEDEDLSIAHLASSMLKKDREDFEDGVEL